MQKENFVVSGKDNELLKSLVLMLVGRLLGISGSELHLHSEEVTVSPDVARIIKNCNSLVNFELPEIPSYMLSGSSLFRYAAEITERYNTSLNEVIDEISECTKNTEHFSAIDSALKSVVNEFEQILEPVESMQDVFFVNRDYYGGNCGALLYFVEASSSASDGERSEFNVLNDCFSYCDLGESLCDFYFSVARNYMCVLEDAISELSEFESVDFLESTLDSVFEPGEDDAFDMNVLSHIKKMNSVVSRLRKGIVELKRKTKEETLLYKDELSKDINISCSIY